MIKDDIFCFFDEMEDVEEIKQLTEQAKKEIKDKVIYRKFLEKSYNRISKIEELLGRLPKKDEQIRIITQKSFNMYVILLYIVEKINVEECFICIYRIDKNSIKGLNDLLKSGNLNNLTLLISNTFKTMLPERYDELLNLKKEYPKINLIFAWNHTKIIGIKTIKNEYYIAEGSGNLSNNARIEQYLFEESKESYNFHKSWIADIIDISAKCDVEIIK